MWFRKLMASYILLLAACASGQGTSDAIRMRDQARWKSSTSCTLLVKDMTDPFTKTTGRGMSIAVAPGLALVLLTTTTEGRESFTVGTVVVQPPQPLGVPGQGALSFLFGDGAVIDLPQSGVLNPEVARVGNAAGFVLKTVYAATFDQLASLSRMQTIQIRWRGYGVISDYKLEPEMRARLLAAFRCFKVTEVPEPESGGHVSWAQMAR